MRIKKKVAVFAAFITTLSSLQARGDEKSKNHNLSANVSCKEMTVYTTRYHSSDKDADKDTKLGKSAYGPKLREGYPGKPGTVSIDPKLFPPGTLVYIRDEKGREIPYVCADTGSAVKSKKASKGKYPVVDIFTPKDITGGVTKIRVITDQRLRGIKGKELSLCLNNRLDFNFWRTHGFADSEVLASN